jgi:hypothetical protein
VIALFDRAAARDFVDVFMLSSRFPKTEMLTRAAEVDTGFDHAVFADMIANRLMRSRERMAPRLPGDLRVRPRCHIQPRIQ